MTKGGRRDGEHEVGLDRTIGRQVTFELSPCERATLWICGKRLSGGMCVSVCFFPCLRVKKI